MKLFLPKRGIYVILGKFPPMKHVVICLIFIAFGCQLTQAQIGKDKYLHFGAGVVAGAGGALLASELSDNNRFWTFTGAVGASLLAGLAKEAIDESNYGGWDNADLGATVLGGITAGVTIDIFTGRKRRRAAASM